MCIIAVTGHRPNKLNWDYTLSSDLVKEIQNEMILLMAVQKVTKAISGMALGIDTLWAITALERNIPLVAAIPFRGQELKWPPNAQRVYYEILSKATEVVYVHDEPAPINTNLVRKYLQDRNEWLVNHADKLLAVWDGSSGGTKNCIDYAVKSRPEMEIFRINPKEIL